MPAARSKWCLWIDSTRGFFLKSFMMCNIYQTSGKLQSSISSAHAPCSMGQFKFSIKWKICHTYSHTSGWKFVTQDIT
jgi:hypothetical protein